MSRTRKSRSREEEYEEYEYEEEECTKIDETDYDKLMGMFKEYNNSLEGEFRHPDIITNSSGLSMTPMGKGGFNRVFLDNNLVCKGDEYIVRIEINPHHVPSQRKNVVSQIVNYARKRLTRRSSHYSESSPEYNEEKRIYRRKLSNFITEMQYGIIASNMGVGPEIYRFGSTIKSNAKKYSHFKSTDQYFYSAIQRIEGISLSDYLMSAVKNTRELVRAKDYIDQIIYKSDQLGDAGMILYDTKPGNAMVDTVNKRVYLIDYDPKFTHYNPNPGMDKYGYLNSVLMLAGCIQRLSKDNMSFHQKQIRNYCVEKLKEIYYDQRKRVIYVKSRFNTEPTFSNPVEDILRHNIMHYKLEPILIHYDLKSDPYLFNNASIDSDSDFDSDSKYEMISFNFLE